MNLFIELGSAINPILLENISISTKSLSFDSVNLSKAFNSGDVLHELLFDNVIFFVFEVYFMTFDLNNYKEVHEKHN